jgi:hypothetical protein
LPVAGCQFWPLAMWEENAALVFELEHFRMAKFIGVGDPRWGVLSDQ